MRAKVVLEDNKASLNIAKLPWNVRFQWECSLGIDGEMLRVHILLNVERAR